MGESKRLRKFVQSWGLVMGPALAMAVFLSLPVEYQDASGQAVSFSYSGRCTLALMTLMAVWWLTEAIEMSVTALVPLALFPVLGVTTLEEAARPYADPNIFLYMGGFLLALSMQRWKLDRRLALNALARVGTRPSQLVGGFMLITATLSALVSNTATTAMMLPIALSVLRLTDPDSDKESSDEGVSVGQRRRSGDEAGSSLGLALMLGIAYAASLGGVTTIVGTPTNVVLVSYLREDAPAEFRMDLGFARWLLIGIPFVMIYLPITWWLLTRILYRLSNQPLLGGRELIVRSLQELGPMRQGERITLLLFTATGFCWIVRPWLVTWSVVRDGQVWYPLSGLSDTGIVMIASLLLFILPVDGPSPERIEQDLERASRRATRLPATTGRTFVMNWETAERLPWGILLLFGGGLSLAGAVSRNGVAEFIGSYVTAFQGTSDWVLILLVATFVIFFTELTSNTATAATLVPLLMALAPGLGVHPYLLAFPATIAASCAFMLPVATPPNAMVFAGGYVQLEQMVRAGFWLNLIGIGLVTLATKLLVEPLFVP